jgi:putative sugar O-methyltransferase
MYSGQAAIDFLALEADKSDSEASSHWKMFTSDFRFTGKEFFGLGGFGGREKPYSELRLWLIKILQKRFRRFGDAFAKFKEIDAYAQVLTTRQGRAYDLDVLRQALTLAFLHDISPQKFNENSTVCVIGDGFATMASLLLLSNSASRVILVNLNKILLVDLWYLKLYLGEKLFNSSVDLVVDEAGLAQALAKSPIPGSGLLQIIAIKAEDHQLIQKCPIDAVVNIASMQEMDPPVVNEYFNDMRAIAVNREVLFYCCNREEKRLPDGTMSIFKEYPWLPGDKILVDELCPWHEFYYSTRPPFFRRYDGPNMHRLVKLQSKDGSQR